MGKDNLPELSHEHLLELAKGIRMAGAKEEELTDPQKLVVAAIKGLVIHVIEGKNLADDYLSSAKPVGELPKNTRLMLGINDWLQVFNPQDGVSPFHLKDLSCELAQITGRNRLLGMTNFKSLSSGWRLGGLSEDNMNEEGVTYQDRIKLLQEDLIAGKLSIRPLNTSITSCSNELGVIIGQKIAIY